MAQLMVYSLLGTRCEHAGAGMEGKGCTPQAGPGTDAAACRKEVVLSPWEGLHVVWLNAKL